MRTSAGAVDGVVSPGRPSARFGGLSRISVAAHARLRKYVQGPRYSAFLVGAEEKIAIVSEGVGGALLVRVGGGTPGLQISFFNPRKNGEIPRTLPSRNGKPHACEPPYSAKERYSAFFWKHVSFRVVSEIVCEVRDGWVLH